MTLKAIADRDGEVETSPLYRGWERQHPVIAQLIRDRRDLLSIVTDLQTELRELDRAVSEYANTHRPRRERRPRGTPVGHPNAAPTALGIVTALAASGEPAER